MPSGDRVHRQLVKRIRAVHDDLDVTTSEIELRQAEVDGLRGRRAKAYRSLAEFHLPEMTAAAVANTLSELDEELETILGVKHERRRELDRLVPYQRDEIQRIQDRRDELTAALNGVGEERERLARVVFADLEANDQWADLFRRARRGEARVEASERRHEVALGERAEKTPEYERDPYFAYLLSRDYGTPQAAGNGLTRRLDAWVAEVVGFEGARAKYDFLSELPEHAVVVRDAERAELAEILDPLVKLEKETCDRHGLTPVLDEGDRIYAARDQVRGKLVKAESRHGELTEELSSLDDTRGLYYETAIDELEAYLESQALGALLARARETGDSRDDDIVHQLHVVEGELSTERAVLAELRERRASLTEKLKELKKVRQEFEANDWDARRSRFESDIDMDGLLVGYLAGRHDSSHIRSQLRASQSFTPVSTDSGFDFFSGGGFGGGGFSSGGGFGGGGGFSTGGGF